jgi:hypothetical protein
MSHRDGHNRINVTSSRLPQQPFQAQMSAAPVSLIHRTRPTAITALSCRWPLPCLLLRLALHVIVS